MNEARYLPPPAKKARFLLQKKCSNLQEAWWPISYERRTVQPLYYSAMRGKRGHGEGSKALRVQALHYSGMRGKRGDEEENFSLGPSWAFNFGIPGSGNGGGLEAEDYKLTGDGEGFPRMIRADGYNPYNQWREWN